MLDDQPTPLVDVADGLSLADRGRDVRRLESALRTDSFLGALDTVDVLDLGQHALRPDGACLLAQTGALKTVASLVLTSNDIGDAGARALVASPHLPPAVTEKWRQKLDEER